LVKKFLDDLFLKRLVPFIKINVAKKATSPEDAAPVQVRKWPESQKDAEIQVVMAEKAEKEAEEQRIREEEAARLAEIEA
jgi:hypothetical protein